MKRRPLPFLLRSLLTFIIPLLLIYLLIASNTGLQSIAWLAQRFVPGLQAIQVQGRLIGPIYIQDFNYHNKEIAIQLQQAAIDWQPKALLKGNVIIENLQANNLTIKILTIETAKKKKETNLNWLNHLYIKNIQLKAITLEPSNLQLKLQGSLTDKWNIQWQAQLQQSTQPACSPRGGAGGEASIFCDQQNMEYYRRQAPGPKNSGPKKIESLLAKIAHKKQPIEQPNKLEAMLQSLKGQITANGTIQGAKLTPQINASINATNLILKQIQAAKLQITITTDLTPNMNSSLTLNASKFKYKDYLFHTLNLQAQGQINPMLALNWQLHASLQPSAEYQGNITASGTISGNYKTPKIAATINAQQGKIKAVKFANLTAQLNANLAAKAQSQLQVTLNGLKIKKYQFASIQLQAILNRARQSLTIQFAKGSMRYLLNDEQRVLTWQASAFNIFQQAQDLIAQGRLTLNAQQYLNIDLKLPHYQFLTPLTPQQPIQGNIGLYVQQIAPFLSAVTVLQNVQGLLHADLQITGTYAKPQIVGAVTLENASTQIPNLNLQIKNIQLKAQGSPGIIAWSGQAQSGQGILYLKGTTTIQQQNYPTNITLTGNNIMVSNTDHYKIIASPNLQVKYTDKRLSVTGSILLPSAHINLGGSSEAVDLSKDVVFVGDAYKKPNYDLPFYAQIQLIIGNDINLHYEGLQTQLRGQLLINDAPNHPVTGVGQISFHEGSYTFYGQTLTLRAGSRVIFNGAIDNPMLNIQAFKQVDVAPSTNGSSKTASDMVPTSTELSSSAVLPGQTQKIIVGVSVQGNTKNPDINLFSEPAILNQTDILSYLVVGEPSDQLSSAGAGVLFNAASSLNFGGTSQLKDTLKELKNTVGVDFNIQSSSYLNPQTNQAQQNTSVVLGKKLSPRIYISYSIGILESLNTFQLRYLLSKNWTLQSTSSSVGNGVDLLYMIEQGK